MLSSCHGRGDFRLAVLASSTGGGARGCGGPCIRVWDNMMAAASAMVEMPGRVHHRSMVITMVAIRSRDGQRVLTRTIPMSADYGGTPEVAHPLIVLALTAARQPVLIDHDGLLWRVPRSRLVAIASWDAPHDAP